MRRPPSATVGIREYIALLLLIIGVKLADSTPALYFDSLLSASWMGPLIGGITAIIPVYFLIKVMTLYEDMHLHDVTVHLFGKFLGIAISFIFWLYGSAVIAVDTRSYVDIIATLYFVKTPTISIFILLMAACAYTAMKGIQILGSLSWLVLAYVKVILIFALLLSIKEANIYAIFPLWGPGIREIITESVFKSSLYGDIFYMGLIFPVLASHKVFTKGTWIALGILTVEISISFLFFILMFDYISVSMLSFPFHELTRYIGIGTFLSNIDTLFFPFWVVASIVRFSVYLYLNALLFGYIFKVNEYKYSIPIFASVYLIVGMIPETPSFTIFQLRDPMYHIFSPVFIAFPILMWIIAKVRGDIKSETTKERV
ncbi:MAG: GerAB/ArcD/ProY family transporter [Neobacillus sp.]